MFHQEKSLTYSISCQDNVFLSHIAARHFSCGFYMLKFIRHRYRIPTIHLFPGKGQLIMSMMIFLSVLSIWGIAVVTPGPNFFITAQISARHSRSAGIFVVLGTCTGTIIWAIAGYLGIAYLFIAVPWIYTSLKTVGGSYIVFLGIRMILNSGKSREKTSIPEQFQSNIASWSKGLLTNLSNPKTAMFITSLFASILPKEPTLFLGFMIVSLMIAVSLTWYIFVVFIFSSTRFSEYYNRLQKWLEGFAGIVFVVFGIKLIFANR